MAKTFLTGLYCSVVLVALGCGGSPPPMEGGQVSGMVTLDGKPVTGGTLTFHEKGGKRLTVPIGPDGQFASPEFPLGEARVSVETETAKTPSAGAGGGRKTNNPEMARMMEGLKKPVYVEIPARYNNPASSGLTITITQGKQKKDFELKK